MKKLTQVIAVLLTVPLATTPLLAAGPLGIDVTSAQGTINWASVKSDGVTFAYAQATSGSAGHDTKFIANMTNGKAAGVYMGAAHFAQPEFDTPALEASNFWSFASSQIGKGGKNIMPALEFEVFSGHVGAGSYTGWANNWSSAVVADAAAVGITLHPVIYITPCNACNLTTNITLYPWIANPNGTGGPWNVCTNCEAWGPDVWDLWQTSTSGAISGISGPVDLDTFNGSLSALTSLLQTK